MDFLFHSLHYDSIDNSMAYVWHTSEGARNNKLAFLADASPEAFTPDVSGLSNFMQVFFAYVRNKKSLKWMIL